MILKDWETYILKCPKYAPFHYVTLFPQIKDKCYAFVHFIIRVSTLISYRSILKKAIIPIKFIYIVHFVLRPFTETIWSNHVIRLVKKFLSKKNQLGALTSWTLDMFGVMIFACILLLNLQQSLTLSNPWRDGGSKKNTFCQEKYV